MCLNFVFNKRRLFEDQSVEKATLNSHKKQVSPCTMEKQRQMDGSEFKVTMAYTRLNQSK